AWPQRGPEEEIAMAQAEKKEGPQFSERVKRLSDTDLDRRDPAPEGKRITIWETMLPGFGCRITDRGVRSFFVRAARRLKGQADATRIVLGEYPNMKTAAARDKAAKYLAKLKEGIDPREEAREEEAKREAEAAAQVAAAAAKLEN